MRRQAKFLVPTHKVQSYDQGVAFHQVFHLKVSKGDIFKGRFSGAGYSTKKRVLHFNFNKDAQCSMVMTEKQSAAYIVGVIFVQQYSLKQGLELFGEKADTVVSKELTQIHDMETHEPVDPKTMTYEDRRKDLASLLFITEKRNGDILGICGSRVLTPDRVPLSLSEMGGPTTGFRWSERTPVEPMVAFKRDTNIASCYSWSRGIYHLIYVVQ